MSYYSPSRAPRIALIGVTGYASIYLQMLRPFMARREVNLVAVVVINRTQPAAEAAALELERWGAKIYENTEEFFAAEAGMIELCLIPTGIAWHARLSVSALQAGMHVLVEKPLAGSLTDVELIQKAERDTGRWVAVGFQDIYSEAATTLRSGLDAGLLGEVVSVSAFGLWPRPVSYYTRNHWAGCLRADGADVLDSPLNNAFAHFVNLGLFFAGSEKDSGGRPEIHDSELWRANVIESFDTAILRGCLQGVRLWFGFSHATEQTHEPEIIVTGTRAEARWVHEKQIETVTVGGIRRTLKMADAFDCRERMLRVVLLRLREPHHSRICDTNQAATHTAFICDVHASGHVRDIPPAFIDPLFSPLGEVLRYQVPGLGNAMAQAFSDRSTLASTGFFSSVSVSETSLSQH